MSKFQMRCKWLLFICVFFLILNQTPCHGQSGNDAAPLRASATGESIPPQIAKEFDALEKRIEQLETELKARKAPAEASTTATTAKATTSVAPAGETPAPTRSSLVLRRNASPSSLQTSPG